MLLYFTHSRWKVEMTLGMYLAKYFFRLAQMFCKNSPARLEWRGPKWENHRLQSHCLSVHILLGFLPLDNQPLILWIPSWIEFFPASSEQSNICMYQGGFLLARLALSNNAFLTWVIDKTNKSCLIVLRIYIFAPVPSTIFCKLSDHSESFFSLQTNYARSAWWSHLSCFCVTMALTVLLSEGCTRRLLTWKLSHAILKCFCYLPWCFLCMLLLSCPVATLHSKEVELVTFASFSLGILLWRETNW